MNAVGEEDGIEVDFVLCTHVRWRTGTAMTLAAYQGKTYSRYLSRVFLSAK